MLLPRAVIVEDYPQYLVLLCGYYNVAFKPNGPVQVLPSAGPLLLCWAEVHEGKLVQAEF